MKKIDININNAQILSFSVALNEDKPEISATVGLFSGNKKISTFSLRTQSFYNESIVFEIPLEMYASIKEMATQLEVILVRECVKQLKQLPAKTK